MSTKNGYFQLDIQTDGTYMIIYPPQEGGHKPDVAEICEYLDRKAISGYDVSAIKTYVAAADTEKKRFKVTNEVAFECDESLMVRASNDNMTAVARFYPPSTKGKHLSPDDIVKVLHAYRIQFGISQEIIKKWVALKIYCTDIIIAKGMPVEQGKDAYITYHFDTNPTSKPKLLEDGSVDFHELNIFTRVQKGDLLATLTPAQEGKPGKDIFGNSIPPAKLKHMILKHGRNLVLSEDKLNLYSEVSGDVKLEGDTVFVSDTYTVPADVDTSTGDIVYDGNVVVTGNVRTGFTIRAKGSVQVNGVVEGAYIYSGDSIVLKRGMQGMSKGLLEAEKDIVAKFVESGTLIAKNDVNVGSLLHSRVDAGHNVIVSGRKAFIIGGEVCARNMIDVHAVGNHMGTLTVLRVGVHSSAFEEYKQLQEENTTIKEEMTKYNQILEMFKMQLQKGIKFTPEQVMKVKSVGSIQKQLDTKFEANESKMKEIRYLIENSQKSHVKISDNANYGTEIYINDNRHVIKDNIRRCKFKLEQGSIVSVSY